MFVTVKLEPIFAEAMVTVRSGATAEPDVMLIRALFVPELVMAPRENVFTPGAPSLAVALLVIVSVLFVETFTASPVTASAISAVAALGTPELAHVPSAAKVRERADAFGV